MNKSFFLDTKNLFLNFLGIISLLIIITLNSCDEDPSALGSEILPESDKLAVYNELVAMNGALTNDEVISTKLSSYPIIGVINDPYFGSIKSSFASTFIPTSLSINFGDVVVDSVILNLAIDSLYGKYEFSKGFEVYQLTKPLEGDSLYKSNSSIEDLININNPISLNSEFSGDTSVRFKLVNSFGEFLVPPSDSIDYYRTFNNFLEKYYGIAIIPEDNNENNGLLINIDIYNKNSKITMYYHEDTAEYKYDYRFYSSDGYHLNFNRHQIDHTTGIVNNYLTDDDDVNDTLLFVQGLGGVNSKIIFKNFLPQEDDTSYSVLKAELNIPALKDFDLLYFYPPEKLYFISSDKDSNLYQIDDYVYSNFFGGTFNNDTYNYTFDISRHFSKLLNKINSDSVLYFRIYNGSIYPHRVILKLNEANLNVTYIKH